MNPEQKILEFLLHSCYEFRSPFMILTFFLSEKEVCGGSWLKSVFLLSFSLSPPALLHTLNLSNWPHVSWHPGVLSLCPDSSDISMKLALSCSQTDIFNISRRLVYRPFSLSPPPPSGRVTAEKEEKNSWSSLLHLERSWAGRRKSLRSLLEGCFSLYLYLCLSISLSFELVHSFLCLQLSLYLCLSLPLYFLLISLCSLYLFFYISTSLFSLTSPLSLTHSLHTPPESIFRVSKMTYILADGHYPVVWLTSPVVLEIFSVDGNSVERYIILWKKLDENIVVTPP